MVNFTRRNLEIKELLIHDNNNMNRVCIPQGITQEYVELLFFSLTLMSDETHFAKSILFKYAKQRGI